MDARRAQSMALALHELATNAVKYGALSRPEGRVRILWRHVEQDGEQRVALAWEERGGPRVEPPQGSGFGTRLIERMFSDELDGDAGFEFRAEGGLFPLS